MNKRIQKKINRGFANTVTTKTDLQNRLDNVITLRQINKDELKRVKNWRSYHNFLNNFEYAVIPPRKSNPRWRVVDRLERITQDEKEIKKEVH